MARTSSLAGDDRRQVGLVGDVEERRQDRRPRPRRADSCGSDSQPPSAATGIVPSSTARPRSAQIITGRRRRRSTQAPATKPTSERRDQLQRRSTATSTGPRGATSIATNGSAIRVTNDPNTEMVAAPQSAQERAVRPQGGARERPWAGGRVQQRIVGHRRRVPATIAPRASRSGMTYTPQASVSPEPAHHPPASPGGRSSPHQGSPSPHVRQPQRPPPQDPRRADRPRPRDRGGRRRRDARGPPRPPRGRRQLQGRQGLRGARARARRRRRGPREPDRRPAGREDRPRGADRPAVGRRPDVPPRRATRR